MKCWYHKSWDILQLDKNYDNQVMVMIKLGLQDCSGSLFKAVKCQLKTRPLIARPALTYALHINLTTVTCPVQAWGEQRPFWTTPTLLAGYRSCVLTETDMCKSLMQKGAEYRIFNCCSPEPSHAFCHSIIETSKFHMHMNEHLSRTVTNSNVHWQQRGRIWARPIVNCCNLRG